MNGLLMEFYAASGPCSVPGRALADTVQNKSPDDTSKDDPFSQISSQISSQIEGISQEMQHTQHKEVVFHSLVQRCWRKGYWIACDLLGNPAEAEDLCQDALLRAYERWESFRGEASLDTWFYRILTNLCLNHRRRRGLWGRIQQWLQKEGQPEQQAVLRVEDSFHPEKQYQARQTGEAIQKAVEHLSPHQKMVFVLRYLHDFSVNEICSMTEMSEGTVKTHIFRALNTMRKHLRTLYFAEESQSSTPIP